MYIPPGYVVIDPSNRGFACAVVPEESAMDVLDGFNFTQGYQVKVFPMAYFYPIEKCKTWFLRVITEAVEEKEIKAFFFSKEFHKLL